MAASLCFPAVLGTLAAALAADEPVAGAVVINEIHYHPDDRTEPVEFVEVLNASDRAVDLSGWKLSGGIDCVLPAGSTLDPGAFLVAARDLRFLRQKYGVEARAEFSGRLSPTGGRLALHDAAGKLVDEVDYRLGFPWPTVGDPPGHSIELVHPALDNSLGGNWRPSVGARPPDAPPASGATPGARNSVFSMRHPPALGVVRHEPSQPGSGQPVRVSVHAGDPDGVARVGIEHQEVDPGSYLELRDPAYATRWARLAMNDEGKDGDERQGDGVFTALIPAELQRHRRLVRYRIVAEDPGGRAVRAPLPEDPQPNFAYFVYDGVPAWRAAVQPGSKDSRRGRMVEFPESTMRSLPVYHLIARRESVEAATWRERYPGSEFKWWGTLVYDGRVYDHIRFRARGGTWRYAMGKNMWKFELNRGHDFEARDEYGRPYRRAWTKLNLGACIQQGDYGWRGEQGMFEAVGFRLFNLAGVEAPRTHWLQLRIIDEAEEAPDQYEGDFWGLYLAVEEMNHRFIEEHGLPDGNLYKMEGGFGELESLGEGGPKDASDLRSFLEAYSGRDPGDDWWRRNLDLPRYFSYRSIVECIHHYDIDESAGKNYFYLRDPRSGRWSVHPWDIDLTWADTMYGGGESPFKRRVFSRPAFRIESRNRLREIRDLLFNEDQAGALIDEYAALIDDPSVAPSMAEADRARWDYHPALADPRRSHPGKAGQGRFYRAAATRDFPGMVQRMKEYVAGRGAWIDAHLLRDPAIPAAPRVSWAGPEGFPPSNLRLRASPYEGRAGFAAIRWRLAEATDPRGAGFRPRAPRRYEIEAAWESPDLGQEGFEIVLPPGAAQPGHRYRARARVRDSTGRWSRWSEPVEFRAGE